MTVQGNGAVFNLNGANTTVATLLLGDGSTSSAQVTMGSGCLTLGNASVAGLIQAFALPGVTASSPAASITGCIAHGALHTWSINQTLSTNGSVNIAANITGAVGITKAGRGALVLSGLQYGNMATGTITMNTDAGSLYVMGNLVGGVTVADPAAYNLPAGTPGNAALQLAAQNMDILGGNGLINGAVTMTTATLSPDTGIGCTAATALTVNGSVSLTNTNYIVDINGAGDSIQGSGANAGKNYTQLNITGTGSTFTNYGNGGTVGNLANILVQGTYAPTATDNYWLINSAGGNQQLGSSEGFVNAPYSTRCAAGLCRRLHRRRLDDGQQLYLPGRPSNAEPGVDRHRPAQLPVLQGHGRGQHQQHRQLAAVLRRQHVGRGDRRADLQQRAGVRRQRDAAHGQFDGQRHLQRRACQHLHLQRHHHQLVDGPVQLDRQSDRAGQGGLDPGRGRQRRRQRGHQRLHRLHAGQSGHYLGRHGQHRQHRGSATLSRAPRPPSPSTAAAT